MKLYVKNMVSARCIAVVKYELERIGYESVTVKLGEADIRENVTGDQLEKIRSAFLGSGFKLLEDTTNILIHRIRTIIIQCVYYSEEPLEKNLSVYLADKLRRDYTYMSNLFSDSMGITIEKFYICHKIERVKELLIYDELSLTAISFKMHYSSVSHLSSQFKKVVGETPTAFKLRKDNRRNLLEDLCK